MKKSNIALILAIVLIVGIFSVSGVAAETDDGPQVRVNGYLVDFPDGKPFINEDARTLIPVRFVTEALGAKVTWDGSTLTAGITKDGTTVEITIGSPDLRVTKNGSPRS